MLHTIQLAFYIAGSTCFLAGSLIGLICHLAGGEP